MQAIPTFIISCSDGSADTYVGINPNISSGDKVRAFVHCFRGAAQSASNICFNLPVKLILAQWGGESGWATGLMQKDNQNWANIIYTNANNPSGNSGAGSGGWAKFCGRTRFAYGYGKFFKKEFNPRYSALIDYLVWCKQNGETPSETVCARYIANAGFGGPDHNGYYDWLLSMIKTLRNHSDF